MKITSLITIAPTHGFHPIANENLPKFSLPILNKPLLSWGIEKISHLSEKILIFCLERHRGLIKNLVKNSQCPVEIIGSDGYENIGTVVAKVRQKIRTRITLVARGDFLILKEGLEAAIQRFHSSSDKIHVILRNSENGRNLVCIDGKDRIHGYREGEISTENPTKVLVSTAYDLIDFQLIKTKFLGEITGGITSIKREIIPSFINRGYVVRAIDLEAVQVRTIKDYIRQVELIKEGELVISDLSSEISEDSVVKRSVLGSGVVVMAGSVIEDCVLMDGVLVEEGCYLRSVVVGKNSVIRKENVIECNVLGHNVEYP